MTEWVVRKENESEEGERLPETIIHYKDVEYKGLTLKVFYEVSDGVHLLSRVAVDLDEFRYDQKKLITDFLVEEYKLSTTIAKALYEGWWWDAWHNQPRHHVRSFDSEDLAILNEPVETPPPAEEVQADLIDQVKAILVRSDEVVKEAKELLGEKGE